MNKTILMATTAVLLSAGTASAQTPVAAPAQAATDQQGVLVFQPAFFADARPNTALDMVDRVPGFSVADGSGSRGFEGAVGNILINGSRPASKNDTGSNVLSRTAASQVERIELIRGGASGIDMQGYSVVVNVILKSESSRQSILTANAVLFEGGHDVYGGTYQFTARDGERSWGITLSDGIGTSDSNGAGRVLRTDALGNVLRDETYFNDGYGGGNGIRANYSAPMLGGKVDLTARMGTSDWHSINLQTSPVARRESIGLNENMSGEFGVVYTRPISQALKLETRFIHQFEDFDNVSTSRTRLNNIDSPEQAFTTHGRSSETILRGLVRYEHSANLTFETGAEAAYNMLDVDQTFTIGGANVPLPSASVMVEETRGELFGKATWRIRSDLNLEAGLRLEASTISQSGDAQQEKSFFFAKPRALATWTPWAGHQFRLRIEREVGQLDFGDFAASADLEDENVFGGNVDLEPEQRWISELSYERRFWGDGIVSISLRHDEITDVIDSIPLNGGLSAVGNIGNGTLDQLALNLTIPTTKLGISGGRFSFRNNWNRTEVTDPTTGKTRPISGIRPTQAVIGFEQDITHLKTQWGINWIPLLGQASYDPDRDFSWRGHNYFEFYAEYKPTPTLSLRAQLNLWEDFDSERIEYADRTSRNVAFTERRLVDPRAFWQLRLRKTF